MWTPEIIALVTATFLFAGIVKGVVGMGLPLTVLGLLTATLGLKQAIVLMLVPALATNIWQGLVGGAFREIVRRLWSLLLASCVGIWIGAGLLARADALLLSGLLGVMLFAYSSFSLATPQIRPPGRLEPWLSPLMGGLGGLSFGLTGTYMVPGVLYIQALGLSRDVLVQTLGIVFVVITATLSLSLSRHGLLPPEMGLMSAYALLPTAAGMVIGQRIRKGLSEALFRRLFFVALLILGAYLSGRAFL
ncbi:MAG: sulfite exporter TauE/SafE family protein [Hyphomicrobiales bacterium]|nr:sulfite exporter TauE/SafE family protein [Hyphomicrobiales bacterium]